MHRVSLIRTWMAGAAAAVAAGCVEPQASGPVSAAAQTAPSRSVGLFSAAIDHFAVTGGAPLLVDPRPLRPDADLSGVQSGDLAVAETAVVRLRTGVLAQRRIATTDATADQRCAFTQGVTPPEEYLRTEPDSIGLRRRECLQRGAYASVIFGLPQRVEGAASAETWKLTAVRITTSSYYVWDLYLRPAAGGRWAVVDAKRVYGIMS